MRTALRVAGTAGLVLLGLMLLPIAWITVAFLPRRDVEPWRPMPPTSR